MTKNESTALQKAEVSEESLIEQIMIKGLLDKMKPGDRVEYYKTICKSLGLNPWTQPFGYMSLDGGLVLYAKKDATDQLRSLRKVSVEIVSQEDDEGVLIVRVRASTPDGRSDEDLGALSMIYPDKKPVWKNSKKTWEDHPKAGERFTGLDLANAKMKCVTKAKRRVTLSICGLGFLDELELQDAGARVIDVNVATGEIEGEIEEPEALEPESPTSEDTTDVSVKDVMEALMRETGLSYMESRKMVPKDFPKELYGPLVKLVEEFGKEEDGGLDRLQALINDLVK